MPSVTQTLPPPIGGWDTMSALTNMPGQNALTLDNWFPSTDKVTLRKGYTSHATGMTGRVETLIQYTGLTGAGKIFAANDGKVYDVSSVGAVGAAVLSGKSNDRWQQVQIGTSGGQFVMIMNGADTPQTYNGTSWANAGMTGPTIANLIWCNVHQRRLWFGEEDSLSAWYLAANAITGSATEFPLHGLASLGGYIMAMGTWSRDAGDGSDDVAVFLTSEGQAIVYQGTDPSAAATWSLVGVFRIGKPIGRRCMIKAGADLIIITQDGFVALSTILGGDRSQTDGVAISAQINKSVNDAVIAAGGTYGWEPFLYPIGTMLIFNVPQSTNVFHQYVFNTITNKPCRFTGLNAICWALNNDIAYFGGTDGAVYRADNGTSDNGKNIEADAVPAFSFFGSPGVQKSFKLGEPIFQSAGNPNAALDLNVDFEVQAPASVASASPASGGLWGDALWGQGTWGSADQIYRGWRPVHGIGEAASMRVRVSTNSSSPAWIATKYLFVPGGQV